MFKANVISRLMLFS